MNINHCIIKNSQIGNENYMTNTIQEIDWEKWKMFCQELKQKSKNSEEKRIVENLEKKIEKQDSKELKKFVKKNYLNFFADILSGIISSNFSELIKKLLFPSS